MMDHDDDAPAPRPDGSVALPVDRPVADVPRTAVTDVAPVSYTHLTLPTILRV